MSELISIAGGEDVFEDRAAEKASMGRGVTWEDVIERQPELMIASWCGKPLDEKAVLERPRADEVPGLRHGQLHEMDPTIILQPGPAALTDGLEFLERLIRPLARA